MSEAERPMTVDQVADYLQVSPRAIYRAVSRQKPADARLPGQKVGKEWRFSRAAVDRWLEAGHGP